MLRKAASRWTIYFLGGFMLTVGVILIVVGSSEILQTVLCQRSQEIEIQNVWLKVEEMRGKAGYETMYFEFKYCVEEIKYVEIGESKNVTVKYTKTNDPINYPANAPWYVADGTTKIDLTEPGNYYFRVFEDRVEVLS